MSAPRDTPEGILADLAQVLLALLFMYPDTPTIPVHRLWIARWYADVSTVLEHLRHR
jgi:hypothetical protein